MARTKTHDKVTLGTFPSRTLTPRIIPTTYNARRQVAAPEMDGFGEDAFGNVEPVPFLDAEDRSGIEVGRDADLEEQSFQVR